MGNVPWLKQQYFDTDGTELASGKMHFFQSGTTTNQNTYSDEDLTSANANPVIADSNGIFGEIYMDPDLKYKVRLTNSSDVQIWEVDNINPSELTSSTATTRLKQGFASPYDFGATGAAADESTEVQAAIDAQNTRGGGVVDLMGDTFRCDSTITLYDDVTLRNGTIDFTNSTSTNFINVAGSISTTRTLSSNATAGDTTVSASNIDSVGPQSVIAITDTGAWGNDSNASGEIVEAESASGSTITLSSELIDSYTTANTAEYKLITTVENVKIEDIRILADVSSGNTTVVKVQYARNVTLRNVVVDKQRQDAITLTNCVNAFVENCVVMGDAASGTRGVLIGNGMCRDIDIRGCKFSRLEQAIDTTSTSGVNRNIIVSECTFSGCNDGVILDENNQFATVSGCHFNSNKTGTNRGIFIECPDVTVTKCFFNRLNTADITIKYDVSAVAESNILITENVSRNAVSFLVDGAGTQSLLYMSAIGNKVINPSAAAIDIDSHAMTSCAFDSNTIELDTADVNGIELAAGTSAFVQISVSGNVMTGGGSSSILVYVYEAGGSLSNVSIDRNRLDAGALTAGIKFTGTTAIDNCSISGNILECGAASDGGIYAEGDGSTASEGITINGNHLDVDTSTDAIVVKEFGRNVVISGNQVRSTCDRGLLLTMSSNDMIHVVVSNNNFVADNHAIEVVGTTSYGPNRISVSGNVLSVSSVSANSHVVEFTGDVTDMSFSGNVCQGGNSSSDVLRFSNTGATVANVAITGCVFDNGDHLIGGDAAITRGVYDACAFDTANTLDVEAVLSLSGGTDVAT